MLKYLLLLLSWTSLSLQINGYPNSDERCVFACEECFWEVTFGTTVETDDYYTGHCQDTLRFESTWLCSKLRCSPREIKAGVKYVRSSCIEHKIELPDYDAVIAKYPEEAIKNMRVFSRPEITPEDIINSTLLPSDELFYQSTKTWDSWLPMYEAHFRYALAMYYFWAVVLFVGVANRCFAAAVHYRQRRIYKDSEAGNNERLPAPTPRSRIRRLIRRYITLPATFGYRHQQPFGWCTVPTRITSLLVFIFVAINIILTSVRYHAFQPYLYDEDSDNQIWGIVTDRAGILAVANMPILWVFAGRNDVLLWLTGWNFATFNSFHRWISRVVTVQVIVHSIGYTRIYLEDGGREQLAEAYREQFWYCGVIATISFSFLLLFSMYPLRQKCYEFFLLSHISLAVIALVCTFLHIVIYDGLYEPYLWPCVAFWVFDRVVRLARLAVLNYKVAFWRHTKLLASYSAERDIIRLTVTPSYHSRPQPGAYYFIYFPTMLKALGNHPFTMATWTAGDKGTLPNPILDRSPSTSQRKEFLSSEIKTVGRETSSQSSGSMGTSDPSMKLHFIIRPYAGLTSSLRERIIRSGHSTIELTALVEGPYGETHPVLTYNNIIFIAGGSGIAAVLPYMQQFLLEGSSQPTKRIHVIWAARQQTFVRDVLDHELAPAAIHPNVKLDLYVTGASPKPVKDKTVDLDRFDEDIGMRYARPPIANLLPAEVRESAGSTAVLVCGPAQMADDARKAAVDAVADGHAGLGYFEEYFGW